MKTDDKTQSLPTALREVLDWKESIWREVEKFPLKQALDAIMNMAEETSKRTRYAKLGDSPSVRVRVAESATRYELKKEAE